MNNRKTAQLCVLAESCDEKAYTKLIEALCKSRGIKLIKVKDKKTLGEWSGLCKIDKEGNPRKVVAASSVAITEFGPKTPAQDMVMESAQFVQ
jgi:small subunit ribosomal protein S12e